MDYSTLSDFDINKRVAMEIGFPCYYKDGSYTNGHCGSLAIVNGRSIYGNSITGGFDPCNNPADAWVIIENNGISITFIGNDGRGRWGADAPSGEPYTYHNNPLRAAMIVFLMMQDKANANS